MLNAWVIKALLEPVFDIGQLSKTDLSALNAQVKNGHLVKGKGGGYPNLKTGYALTGFDFSAHRNCEVHKMLSISKIEGA